MRRSFAGPGTNNWKPKQDAGKTAGAAETTGYRRTAVAAGPASVKEYHATTDIGKHAPAGRGTAAYRSTSVAAGTFSSLVLVGHSYRCTLLNSHQRVCESMASYTH